MTKAEIIADSINDAGERITTFILTYPRYIHSEFMTHRLFSRNAASSRAIPIEKMMKMIEDDPVIPEFWGKNQKGMQSFEPFTDPNDLKRLKKLWLYGRNYALDIVSELDEANLHKQWANRPLEPWMHITVLCTATHYNNFFKLRAHPDAMPDFQVLAFKMLDRYLNRTPDLVEPLGWHIPYSDKMPDTDQVTKLKIAVARAARLSYLTQDGVIDIEKDIELFERLRKSGHWSPFEHVAQCAPGTRSGNFVGWVQFRKDFMDESGQDVNLAEILKGKPSWITL